MLYIQKGNKQKRIVILYNGNLPLTKFLYKLKGREGVFTRGSVPGQLFVYMQTMLEVVWDADRSNPRFFCCKWK